MTNYNVEEKNLLGEQPITREHVQNNKTVREMLGKRGIKPEELPPAEDIKKVERKIHRKNDRKITKKGEISVKKVLKAISKVSSNINAIAIIFSEVS